MGWTMALGCLCFTLTNQHRWKQELQPTRELGFHHNYRNFAIVDLHLCSYVLNSCFKHSTSCTGQFEHPPPRCYCSGLYSLLQNSRNAHSLYTYLIDSLSRREVLQGVVGSQSQSNLQRMLFWEANMLLSPTYFLQGPVNLNLVSFCVISPVFEEVLLGCFLPVLLIPMKNVFSSAL